MIKCHLIEQRGEERRGEEGGLLGLRQRQGRSLVVNILSVYAIMTLVKSNNLSGGAVGRSSRVSPERGGAEPPTPINT